MAPLVDLSVVNIEEGRQVSLKWTDEGNMMPLSFEGPDDEDLINKHNPPPIKNHRENRNTRSALKGGKQN